MTPRQPIDDDPPELGPTPDYPPVPDGPVPPRPSPLPAIKCLGCGHSNPPTCPDCGGQSTACEICAFYAGGGVIADLPG